MSAHPVSSVILWGEEPPLPRPLVGFSFSFAPSSPFSASPRQRPGPQRSEMHPILKSAFSNHLATLTGQCPCFLLSGDDSSWSRVLADPAGLLSVRCVRPEPCAPPGLYWDRRQGSLSQTQSWILHFLSVRQQSSAPTLSRHPAAACTAF